MSQKTIIPERYRDDPNVIFVDPEKVEPEFLLETIPGQDTLNRINQRVGSTGESIEDILNFVFNETRDMFECDRIGLAFLTDNNERVTAYMAVSDYSPMLLQKGYSEDLRGSSLEYILRSGRTRIIEDLEAYFRKHPGSRSSKILLEEGVRSNMTSPLMVDDRIVGLFFRSSRKPKAYRLKHVHTHLSLADRLSQVVEKAYRIEQLKLAMNSYTEMLGFVSHEIKSPLSTIIMDCKMMLDGYMGSLDSRVEQRIQRIVDRGEYLLGMVREYLDLARIEGGELKLRSYKDIDLKVDILEYAIDMHQSLAEENAMTCHLEAPPTPVTVKGDPGLLRIVAVNLMSNAIKYGARNGRIKIVLSPTCDGARFSVQNDGPGFPESEVPNLFRKFSRIQTPELIKKKGTGVGLYTVWRIVKLHRGKIRAESRQGSWARFTVDLPFSEEE
ncbi:MAG TPA: GAF domain-containing sensor histidine kinase [bacterium]|nr:GAF domain-containing sensor histidine kinase [bacterium]